MLTNPTPAETIDPNLDDSDLLNTYVMKKADKDETAIKLNLFQLNIYYFPIGMFSKARNLSSKF